MEDRRVLSTFFVESLGFPLDAIHVHTLQDALNAAAANDTIQIEPGASVASVGNTVGAVTPASTLAAGSAAGATFLRVEYGRSSEGSEIHIVFGDRERPPLLGPFRYGAYKR